MIRQESSLRGLKLGVLVFALAALAFSLAAGPLGYVLDLTRISGRKPETKMETAASTTPAGGGGGATAAPPNSTANIRDQDLFVLPAATPPEIDGLTKDWVLTRGVFVTDDYVEHSGSLSVWYHLMYDADQLYLLARVRDRDPLNNAAKALSDPTAGDVVQFQFETDQPVLLNAWRTESGAAVLQAFYPKRDAKKEKPRVDALAAGAKLAVANHTDGFGCDVEAAVPWAVLRRDGKPCHPGQVIMGNLAVRLSRQQVFGTLMTDRYVEGQLGRTWFLTKLPERAAPVFNGARNKLFPVRQDGDVLKVAWDRPLSPFQTWNQRLPITPAGQFAIDGKLTDWPGTAGIVCSGDVRKPDSALAWLQAAADDTNLYLAAVVMDPTPDQDTDGLELRLQTDQVHVLKAAKGRLTVDDQSVTGEGGGKLARTAFGDGSGYVLEAKVPWLKLGTSGGPPREGFPVTVIFSLSADWQIRDLVADYPGPEVSKDPATWGRAVFLEAAPDEPRGVPIMTGNLLALDVKDGRVRLMAADTQGLAAARSPYETSHRFINILPGTAQIDGDAGEWDLSGGVFFCMNVEQFRDCNCAWLHAMYDKDYAYFLWRYRDATPMNHRPDLVSHRDDCCQIRIGAGELRHFNLFYADGRPRADLEKGDHAVGATTDADPLPFNEGLKMAFKKAPDELGYNMEVAIPWKLITADGQPLAPGFKCIFTAEVRTEVDLKTGDIQAYNADWVMVWRNREQWGEARFLGENKIAPQPVRLRNGQRLPVTMVGGLPQVDWALLKSGVDAESKGPRTDR